MILYFAFDLTCLYYVRERLYKRRERDQNEELGDARVVCKGVQRCAEVRTGARVMYEKWTMRGMRKNSVT